ncbi:MAG: outer membrane beta-barrel protein [Gammaproteobacteria bacterium]
MRQLILVLCLLACGSVAAQDETSDSDYQQGNSFSDIEEQAQSDAANEADSDTPDANSFSDDTPASNSFGDDAPDANSFSGEDAPDANSFSGSAYEEASDEDYGEAAEEKDEPLELYAGADYVWSNVSFSKPAFIEDFGDNELSSSMYRVRAGMRLHERIGIEAQVGLGDTDTDGLEDDEYSTSQFYAIYLVPTGVLLDLFEVAASIGYAHTELERADVSESLGGASFGINVEVPLYTGDAYELRIGGGGAVFRAQNSARIYGYHAGLRVDFKI